MALDDWKSINMIGKENNIKATNKEFSDDEINKLINLGFTPEQIIDFENKGTSFEEISK